MTLERTRLGIAGRGLAALIALGLSLLALLFIPARAPADAGHLDRSFGGDDGLSQALRRSLVRRDRLPRPDRRRRKHR